MSYSQFFGRGRALVLRDGPEGIYDLYETLTRFRSKSEIENKMQRLDSESVHSKKSPILT